MPRPKPASASPLILAITGATGAVYAQRLLQVLIQAHVPVHLTVSPAGALIIRRELGIPLNLDHPQLVPLSSPSSPRSVRTHLTYHHHADIAAPISSGTFQTRGMVIIPCSMDTVGALAAGLGGDLIERAATVTLKEGRRLVLVPRETPLSAIHLENLLRLSRAGACILPAMPAFYQRPKTIADQVDFIVGKVLDQFGIEHTLFKRWGSP